MSEPYSLPKFEEMTSPVIYEKFVKRGVCTIADWKVICQKIKEKLRTPHAFMGSDTGYQDWNILYIRIHKGLNDPDQPYAIRFKVASHFNKYEQYIINVELNQDLDYAWYVDDVTTEKIHGAR